MFRACVKCCNLIGEPEDLSKAVLGAFNRIVMILETGQNPRISSFQRDTKLVVQYLSLLDNKDIREALYILKTRYPDHVSLCYSKLVEKLPLVLPGLPLPNAVIAASVPAVKGLLELGADPFSHYSIGDYSNQMTAVEIAISLHLLDIIEIFAKNYAETPKACILGLKERRSRMRRLIDDTFEAKEVAKAFQAASSFHKCLIHGSNVTSAKLATINYFLEMPGPFRLKERDSVKFLQNLAGLGVMHGDFDLFQTLIRNQGSMAPGICHPGQQRRNQGRCLI